MRIFIQSPGSSPGGTLLLQRLAGAVLGVIVLGLALFFASVVLTVLLAIGVLVWAWLWWRTRHLRKAARESRGRVIEGSFRDETVPVRVERLPDRES